MKRNALRCLAIVLLSVCCWAQAATPQPLPKRPAASAVGPQRTAQYFASIRRNPLLLLEFLRAMPKGGDLHNHLSGAVYAESYVQWAADDGFCLNRQALAYTVGACDSEKGLLPASAVLRDGGLYQQVINALSMRFFTGPESAHDHFFNTFGRFGAVSSSHTGEMLAEVASRAAAQHELYLELMLAADKLEAARLGAGVGWDPELPNLRQRLLDAGVSAVVGDARRNLDQAESKMRQILRCDKPDADPGCNISVRFQYEVHRGLPPEVVFAEMLTGFELAGADARVLALNLVMPEDAYTPMHDFDLHMRMLDYLHGVYPRVNITLHAGELAPGLVPPEGLRSHIRDSIARGHASRIGHGVDVMYERQPDALLQQMARNHILVEICLTSNDLILGVRGDGHPLPVYMRAGVPVALSTDDEGVSRIDLTHEFLRAVETYNPSYDDVKRMARNSLEYAFLPGQSLWADSTSWRPATACAHDRPGATAPSAACSRWLESNEKARLQWKLEQELAEFEAQPRSGR